MGTGPRQSSCREMRMKEMREYKKWNEIYQWRNQYLMFVEFHQRFHKNGPELVQNRVEYFLHEGAFEGSSS